MIMVAAGTGLAPMRGLLQHRVKQGSLQAVQLLFGCCDPDRDLIYEQELKQMQRAGLELSLAFSRQSEHKVYVQHLLREQSAAVYDRMHHNNGYLVVCGGTAMGSAVQAVLVDCGIERGGLSPEASEAWVDSLLASGHYVQELWS
jgi:sulfite reductase alpha subunit-like flavoprotein